MNSWAFRRKAVYMGAAVLFLTAVSFAIFWSFWYEEPSCFDGLKDGDEFGVDCGGSCTLICSDSITAPIIRWDPRLFEISPGLWSALVYVENPNIKADAVYLPYSFTIYDANNEILEEREGATILPRNQTVGIFEGPIVFKGGERPKRAIFELGGEIVWEDNAPKEDITIKHGQLLNYEKEPRVEATVTNNTTKEVKNIELIIAVFDSADNAIAASRTFIKSLKKNESMNVFFAWPKPFKLGSKFCEKQSDVMLLLDRSGSMAALGPNPPEPLSTAKDAAMSFVDRLSMRDRVGVVSFATNSRNPIDLGLNSDLELVKQTIGSVDIGKEGTQYTNIYEALNLARQELVSAKVREDSSRVAILLTDGIANRPQDPKGLNEDDHIKYAESLALAEATNMKKAGLLIYTIGLGDEINEVFLKAVASEEANYFFAPSAFDLENIYEKISSSICEEIPARIDITYKIFGDLI